MQVIEQGFVAFFAEGDEGVGAVTGVSPSEVVIYVENFGAFNVPMSAVKAVHDEKVIIARTHVSRAFLLAVEHAHDAEDPKQAG